MHKIYSTLLTFLTISCVAAGNVFATETRTALELSSEEREHVLAEMRVFLESVQSIIAATSQDDIPAIVASARKSGRAAQGGAPKSLAGKLPPEFKKLGMATHQAFDQLAIDAEAMEDKSLVIEQLGQLMENCVSCHGSFYFKLEK